MANESAILGWMAALPAVGALAVLALPAGQAKRPQIGARVVALAISVATLIIAGRAANLIDWGHGGELQLSWRVPWLRGAGIDLAIGADGLSMALILLTAAMGVVACWTSYGIKRSVKVYFALLQFALAAALGFLILTDLVLMAAALLIAVVVISFLIGGWGGERATSAAKQFFWYGLFASAAVLAGAIVSAHSQAAGWSWMMAAGFLILLPAVPLHRWLGDVMAEAATPVALWVAAILQTCAAYGLIRAGFPLWLKTAGADGGWWLALLGLILIAYGALAALGAKDLRRALAFASMGQMGFVLLGVGSQTPMGIMGAAYLLVGHAVAMAMLLFSCGMIRERVEHCTIDRLGGLGGHMPVFGGWGAVGFLAAMGLPGMCVFVGQLLALMGAFSAGGQPGGGVGGGRFLWLGIFSAAAWVILAGFFVWTYQRVFLGPPRPEHSNVARMSITEKWVLAVLGISAVVLGILPMIVTEAMRGALEEWLRVTR